MLAEDPQLGVPGLTDDAAAAEALLGTTLALARRVAGVGRVLLFHPVEAESRLASRALGFRLWPQSGETPGERYANAFAQSVELGYEGAVVIGVTAATLPAELIGQAAALLEEHHGAIVPDGQGRIALLALQEPQPTIFGGPDVPTYDELRTRASQQLVRLVELPEHASVTDSNLDEVLSGAR